MSALEQDEETAWTAIRGSADDRLEQVASSFSMVPGKAAGVETPGDAGGENGGLLRIGDDLNLPRSLVRT